MTSSKASQRGAVIIEASLTLMLFLVIVIGLFDFGFLLFQQQTLTHQARTAARYAVVNAYEDAATLNPKVQKLALCGNTTTCAGAFGLVPGDVTVQRRGTGTTEDSITVTIPGRSYNPLAPGRIPLPRPQIVVTLPVENTTSIGTI